MSYASMEEGAVPGARDRSTGPVTLYRFSSMGKGTSRALNRTERCEQMAKLGDELEEKVEAVHAQMAKKYLAFLRGQLVEFNTRRHVIWIEASMGTCNVHVDGRYAYDLRARGAVVDRIQEIDQLIDGSWAWCSHLNGQRLNGRPGKVSKGK